MADKVSALADKPPEFVAGAFAAVAAICGVDAYKPPIDGGAQLRIALDTALDRLAPFFGASPIDDDKRRAGASKLLWDFTFAYTAIAYRAIGLLVAASRGETTEQRLLELIEHDLAGELEEPR